MGAEEGGAQRQDEALALVVSAAYVLEDQPVWVDGKDQ